MRLKQVEIDNFRAIKRLVLPLGPSLTVLHGDNAKGKTSVLGAIAVGLSSITKALLKNSGVVFSANDQHWGASHVSVSLISFDGEAWTRTRPLAAVGELTRVNGRTLAARLSPFIKEGDAAAQILPIVAYYGVNRAVFEAPTDSKDFNSEFSRFGALKGALTAKTDFRAVFEWFHARQHEELLEQSKRRSFDFHLKDLEAVRSAITMMIPGASDPRIELKPLNFMVSLKTDDGTVEDLSLSEMSGGYRIMLALVADLARRMAQGNPHLDDPLRSEAVVLIDEVDLHLHPSWQQRVLSDLMRTFPNTQFIVTTHSPQVLSTVKPEHIVRLSRVDGEIIAERATSATYGAESGSILQTEMGVSERPKNEFSDKLAEYFSLIDRDEHGSDRARELRKDLEELSPRDSGLSRADGEVRRREVLRSLGRKP
jgi:predicted ATP-binding protein involved in virulence